MLQQQKISLQAPAFADVCKRSRGIMLDVEFEEFEEELLAAIELEEQKENELYATS